MKTAFIALLVAAAATASVVPPKTASLSAAFARQLSLAARNPAASCNLCVDLASFAKDHAVESKAAFASFVSETCANVAIADEACARVNAYSVDKFYTLVSSKTVSASEACAAVSMCKGKATKAAAAAKVVAAAAAPKAPKAAAAPKAPKAAAAPAPKKDASVVQKLHHEKNNGHISECAVCRLGVSWLQSQFGVLTVDWAQEFRRVLQYGFCEQDKFWGPLCDVTANYGEYRVLAWLSDNRVTPEEVCGALNACEHHGHADAATLAARFAHVLRQEERQVAHGWGAATECHLCAATVDFIQGQAVVAGITLAEDARQIARESCNWLVHDRGTELSKFCQSLNNWSEHEFATYVFDSRVNGFEACAHLGACGDRHHGNEHSSEKHTN